MQRPRRLYVSTTISIKRVPEFGAAMALLRRQQPTRRTTNSALKRMVSVECADPPAASRLPPRSTANRSPGQRALRLCFNAERAFFNDSCAPCVRRKSYCIVYPVELKIRLAHQVKVTTVFRFKLKKRGVLNNGILLLVTFCTRLYYEYTVKLLIFFTKKSTPFPNK